MYGKDVYTLTQMRNKFITKQFSSSFFALFFGRTINKLNIFNYIFYTTSSKSISRCSKIQWRKENFWLCKGDEAYALRSSKSKNESSGRAHRNTSHGIGFTKPITKFSLRIRFCLVRVSLCTTALFYFVNFFFVYYIYLNWIIVVCAHTREKAPTPIDW